MSDRRFRVVIHLCLSACFGMSVTLLWVHPGYVVVSALLGALLVADLGDHDCAEDEPA